MKNRWNPKDASAYQDDPVGLRAYTSRLLGADPDLVLHGGGNTSVKVEALDLFGEPEPVLYVKGSGWDLGSIEPAGFTPLRLGPVRKLTGLGSLSDPDMMAALRSASRDPDAPAPSVETITHAIIPHRFVDHTHADAIVTISNTPGGAERLHEIYGESTLIIPYAMPGFVLAKLIDHLTRQADWDALAGLVLVNHGVFTFAGDAKISYDKMITLVAQAEAYIASCAARKPVKAPRRAKEDLEALALLRKEVSTATGAAVLANLDGSPEALTFAGRADAEELSARGCLMPDHVIHVKPRPLMLTGEPSGAVSAYVEEYRAYFDRNASPGLAPLDPAPAGPSGLATASLDSARLPAGCRS